MGKDLATNILVDPHLYVSRPFDQLLVQSIYFLRYNIVPYFYLKIVNMKLFFISNSLSPTSPPRRRPCVDYLWFTARKTHCMHCCTPTSPEPAGLSLVPSALQPEVSTLLPGSAAVRRRTHGKTVKLSFKLPFV